MPSACIRCGGGDWHQPADCLRFLSAGIVSLDREAEARTADLTARKETLTEQYDAIVAGMCAGAVAHDPSLYVEAE